MDPVDYKTRGGRPSKLPRILGGNVAGIVSEADEDGKVGFTKWLRMQVVTSDNRDGEAVFVK